MLLLSPAFAGAPPDVAAVRLLNRAGRQEDASKWFDSDAYIAHRYRSAIQQLHTDPWGGPARDEVLALVDPEHRALRGAQWAAVPPWAERKRCKVNGEATTWSALPAGAPELARWWPRRGQLLAIALVPMQCTGSVFERETIVLTLDKDAGWRIADFPDTAGAAAWRAEADEAGRDVNADRTARWERSELPPVTIESWSSPSLPRVTRNRADVDGDGRDDAVLGGVDLYLSAAGTVQALPGQRVLVGDVDGDGRADLLSKTGGLVPGGDESKLLPLEGADLGNWAAADLDGDGRGDLVRLADGAAQVWFGGQAAHGGVLRFGAAPKRVVAAGDLDRDGNEDLALLNPDWGDASGAIHLVFGGAKPRALTIVGRPLERLGARATFGDLDGDGASELIVGRVDGATGETWLDVYGADGEARQTGIAKGILDGRCGAPVAGDLSGDARAEVVVACEGGLRVWVGDTLRSAVGATDRTVEPVVLKARVVLGGDAPRVVDGDTLELGAATVLRRLPAMRSTPDANSVHWSELKPKKRVTPPSVPLPDGQVEATCSVTLTVGPDGGVVDVAPLSCTDDLFAAVRPAALKQVFYPMRDPKTVRVALKYVFKLR